MGTKFGQKSPSTTTFLTIDQVVARLHEAGLTDLNRKWVTNQCDRRQIPYTIVGTKRRIRSDVIEARLADWFGQALVKVA